VAWGDVMEEDVLEGIDAWIQQGGTLIYPAFPRGPLSNVEGESKIFNRWTQGKTGAGVFRRFVGDMEPPSLYADFVKGVLVGTDGLHAWTRAAVTAQRPEQVFLSMQADGHVLVLN
jgi:hypothetical protein